MSTSMRFAYALVAAVIVLADLWIVVLVGHLLPEDWMNRWYGFPTVMTLMFMAMIIAAPAVVLIDCLITGKPLDPKHNQDKK